MAVELDGNVRVRGDHGPGVGVRVVALGRRIKLVSGNELLGDWDLSDIGIDALQEGFNIKAEGEEFILSTEDDLALADEIGVATASPRLARRLAARHDSEATSPLSASRARSANLAAIGFALAGALVVLGGTLLSAEDAASASGAISRSADADAFQFWLAFVVGGSLMIGAAYVISIGARVARLVAILALVAVVVVFGFAVNGEDVGADGLMAYGLIGGGLVVGVAVLVSGSLGQPE